MRNIKTQKQQKKLEKRSRISGKSVRGGLFSQHWQVITLVLCTILLYAPSIRYDFVVDDKLVLSGNTFVQQGIKGIPDLLTKGAFEGNPQAVQEKDNLSGGRYRPFTMVMFAFEVELFGSKPAVHHGINILLYGILIGLMVIVLKALLSERDWLSGFPLLPFFTVLLFTLHPTHTEVVANIKSRDEIVCVLFCFVSLWYAIRYTREEKIKDMILSAGSYFLALFAKESAIIFVFLIPLSIWFFVETPSRRIVRVGLMVLAVAIVFFIVRAQVVGFLDTRAPKSLFDNPFLYATIWERSATIMAGMGRYLLSALYPFTLSYDYSYNQIPVISWTHWQAIAGFVVTAALIGGTVYLSRKRHIVAYCGWFYLAGISIVSNVVFSVGTLMADRFLFLPTFAGAMAITWVVWRVAERRWQSRTLVVVILSGIGLVYTIRTVSRLPDWRDEYALVAADVVNAPESLRNRRVHAGFLFRQAQASPNELDRKRLLDEAYKHLHYSLSVNPNADPQVYFYLGQYYSIFYPRFDSSVYYFRQAVRLDQRAA